MLLSVEEEAPRKHLDFVPEAVEDHRPGKVHEVIERRGAA